MFNLGAFLSYVFVVSFTPGPNNILSLANGSRDGYKKTLNFILGVSVGFFVVMILCSYFNILLFNLIPKVKIFMGILGAGYMVYLAIKIMKSNERKTNLAIKNTSALNLFLSGLTMQFVNPKCILFGITVVSNFIIPYYSSNLALLFFSIFLAFISYLATSSWAIFGCFFNKFLSNYRKQFNILMGILLIYSAFAISGLTSIFF